MNIFKWILLTVFLHGCMCGGVFAQSLTENKVSSFNIAWGTEYLQNYVKNPSARLTTQYRTLSNFNVSSGSGSYENAGGWDLNATATSGYFQPELHPFAGEDTVGDCTWQGYFNGTAANYKAQIVDGSGTELAFVQLRDVTSITPFSVVFPCGATGARFGRIAYTSTGTGATFNAGRFTYKKYLAQTVPDGASFVGSIRYASTAACTWSRTGAGSNSFANFSADTDCPTPTVKGNVSAPGTKIPAITLPAGMGPGRYVFKAIGGFYKSGTVSSSVAFRFSDGTNSSTGSGVYVSSTISGFSPVIDGEITYNTSLSSATTVNVQGLTDSTSNAVSIDVQSGGVDFEIQVYRYPLNGTAYSNVVPASCINNPDCQNNFSAKVAAANTVSDENSDFINGNCAITDTSLYTCTFVTGRFSVTPNCTASLGAAGDTTTNTGTITIDGTASDATKLVYRISYNSAKTAIPARIACSRAGSDVKPWGPIPLLSGTSFVDGTGVYRRARAYIASTGVVTYLTGVTPWLTSCGSTNGKSCTFLNTPAFTPQCTISTIGTSSASQTNIQALSSTTITLNGFITNTAASSNVDVTLDCEWSR